MPLEPWTEIDSVYHRIALGHSKLVGWGASGSFKAAYAANPLRLAYLVDRDPAKWGTRVWGIEVYPPEVLAKEDPEHTVVMIYSAFLYGGEILRAIDALGPFSVVMPDAPHLAETFARGLRDGIDPSLWAKPPARTDLGILVQGPCVPGVTEPLLRFYASGYPHDRVVLSTWEDTPAAMLEQVAPWTDAVVLSAPPVVAGPQNRNMQQVSTMAGLNALAAAGTATVLKTRTDTLVAATDVLRRAVALRAAFPAPAARALGQRHPIVISNRFTFKYLPYTMSDIVQVGDMEDLQRYWSAPMDERSFSPYTPEWRGRSFRAFAYERGVPEIHFLSHFCHTLGRSLAWSTEDHWALLRDHFILVDEHWFGLSFPKYGLDDIGRFGSGRTPGAIADHGLWERLRAGFDLKDEAAAVDIDAVTFDSIVAVPSGLWPVLEARYPPPSSIPLKADRR